MTWMHREMTEWTVGSLGRSDQPSLLTSSNKPAKLSIAGCGATARSNCDPLTAFPMFWGHCRHVLSGHDRKYQGRLIANSPPLDASAWASTRSSEECDAPAGSEIAATVAACAARSRRRSRVGRDGASQRDREHSQVLQVVNDIALTAFRLGFRFTCRFFYLLVQLDIYEFHVASLWSRLVVTT